MLALIKNNTILSTVQPNRWFDLPNGSRVSPARDGWTDDEHRLAAILPADPVPEGKRVVSADVQLVDGQPRYVHVLEDEPAIDLIAYASQKRWEIETGGIDFNGQTIDTSRESQSMIAGAYAYSQANPSETIQFKAATGWVTLDALTLAAIATAVGAHAQSCFALEASVTTHITNGEITSVEEIDSAFNNL